MKRDCGKGELIPVAYEVVLATGQSDEESKWKFDSMVEAQKKFDELQATLVPCSSLRLYVKDKQGYANCILNHTITLQGKEIKTDRRNEL